MKADARIHAGNQELIRPNLCNDRRSMRIFRPQSATSVRLRKAEGDSSLPRAKIQLLRGLPRLFNAGLELAIELQLRNLTAHGADECEVVRMRLPRLVAENIPSGFVDAERRETDGPVAERVEEELRKAVSSPSLRNPQRIIRTVIRGDQFTVKGGVITVDIRADQVNRRRKGLPQTNHLLHCSAAWILNAWNRYLALRQLCRWITDPNIDVVGNKKLSLAGCGNLVHIFSLMVGLESLIGLRTKDLAPRSRLLVNRGKQISRALPGELPVRFLREIANAADAARLILH